MAKVLKMKHKLTVHYAHSRLGIVMALAAPVLIAYPQQVHWVNVHNFDGKGLYNILDNIFD